MSIQAKYWLKGYLTGSEPQYPVDEEGDPYPPDHPEDIHWVQSVELFHQTGYWNLEDRYCEKCGKRLLHSYVGTECADCQKGDAS